MNLFCAIYRGKIAIHTLARCKTTVLDKQQHMHTHADTPTALNKQPHTQAFHNTYILGPLPAAHALLLDWARDGEDADARAQKPLTRTCPNWKENDNQHER